MPISGSQILKGDAIDLNHGEIEDEDEAGPLLDYDGQLRSSDNEGEGEGDIVEPSFDKLVLYFMVIHFFLAFCQIILVAPLIRLFENSLCLSYHEFPVGGIEESLCKIPKIQGPLATIRGWKSTLDTIPVLIVAIPLGRIGDFWGHRKILALSLVGVALSLVQIFIVCTSILFYQYSFVV